MNLPIFALVSVAAQKSASSVKTCCSTETPTPDFEYSPTRFSKKLVFPCSEIISIQSKGFFALNSLGTPKATSKRSAQNSMYSHIKVEFIPINSTGSESLTNSSSMATASRTISCTRLGGSLFTNLEYIKQAKSQCSPSSRLMSSLEKHNPG